MESYLEFLQKEFAYLAHQAQSNFMNDGEFRMLDYSVRTAATDSPRGERVAGVRANTQTAICLSYLP